MNKNIGKGKKYDKGKLRFDLIPADVIKEVAEIFTFGAEKYGDNNWQNVEHYRYVGAIQRHLNEYLIGVQYKNEGKENWESYIYDGESGKHHLVHVIVNAIFLLWKEKNQKW